MLSSRLFWRMFGAYAVLFLVSAMILVALLSDRQRTRETYHVKLRLRDTAYVMRSGAERQIASGPSVSLQDKFVSLGKRLGVRLTLIADSGEVIADSDHKPATMDDHGDRDEVRAARRTGSGTAVRTSPTLGIPMMYYALRVGAETAPVGYVRTAMALSSLEEQARDVRRIIWATAVPVVLVTLVVTYFVVGRIARPLVTLTHAAEGMAGGELHQKVDVPQNDELGRLGTAFNSMSEELANRIEELQNREQELRENSRLLETILGSMVEGVLLVDEDQRVLYANKAARDLLETPQTGLVGRPLWESARHPQLQKHVEQTLAGRSEKLVELEVPRLQRVIALSASRVPSAGVPGSRSGGRPGAVVVLQDITELRRLENMRREFVSNVSHELKTPLTSIQAYAETLLNGAIDDPEHNREFVSRIGEQAERLHHQIVDLLSLARIESGAPAFDIVSLSVADAIEKCVTMHAPVAEAKSITLAAEGPFEGCDVLADAEGLREIFENLIDNAISYTPQGGQVSVTWAADDDHVRVSVSDTGPGIPEEHLSRIFERFYRVDRARSRELGGTGLGLSIVKHLVQVFHGAIEVDSTPGEGSTFTVTLPRATSVTT